jgi:L-lactate dehydrogenase complex protein LldF
VAKSKSMATEEIDLNPALEAAGKEVVETDLGEWIVQLAGETPSHIIAPALHRDRHQIRDLFVDTVAAPPSLGTEPAELVRFARGRLREVFLAAEVGITGANIAVAETGSIVLVTNEGNGRLVTALPRVHVAVLGMERLAADWAQADLLLALLARSATGQRLSSYTNVVTGARAAGETDGPDELHVVILDNGRSDLLAGEHHEMLGCIRCGACLNVCPVYRQTGGHAYGWVYPGPMGAVLTPLLAGGEHPEAAEVAGASTLCGACMDACPVQIPLQDLLLSLRRDRAAGAGRSERAAWRAWSAAWSDARGYGATTRAAGWGRWAADLAGHLPVGRDWAAGRAVPRPAAERFRDRWRAGS